MIDLSTNDGVLRFCAKQRDGWRTRTSPVMKPSDVEGRLSNLIEWAS